MARGDMSKKVQTFTEQIWTSAVACDGDYLAVCHGDGCTTFNYPDYSGRKSEFGIFEYSCMGVQFSSNGLILLGSEKLQSFSRPGNWGFSLKLRAAGRDVSEFQFGPGNWTMVQGLSGNQAIVFDTSEGQGIMALDMASASVRWHQKKSVGKVWPAANNQLLAMG